MSLVIISLFVVVCFLVDNVLNIVFGAWFHPNLLIIVVVFFNLFRGTRYSLAAAILAGLLKDSFAVKSFGLNVFSFVASAYLTTFLKLYIYQASVPATRVLLIFIISFSNVALQYVLGLMTVPLSFPQAFRFVFVPEVLATTVASAYVFEKLKKCALRLFA